MKMITTNKELLEFCQPLLDSDEPLAIGIDTEFLRERTFWPKLCLIQITSPLVQPTEPLLIDPLLKLDLSPLQSILAASHITKVIHSARQDLEIFWHELRTLPEAFFDTQIAAMVCGLGDGVGYSTLVKLLFEKDVNKDSQYTDWSRRPLTDKQLAYALADAVYLLPAYEVLKEKLTQMNRWEWMEDDLSTLLSPTTYETEPEHAWLRIHSHRHKPHDLAYMQDVCAWREINATRLNVNRGRLLRDECVLKIGLTPPKTIEELIELADSPTITFELANELFETIVRAFDKPKESWPKPPKKHILSTITRQRLVLLREKLNEIAQKLNVPARIIAPKQDLIALAEGEQEGNRLMTGWRHEIFGQFVDEVLSLEV
jgi:ribonuclease D